MPALKFFADNPAEVGLSPDKAQALMDRAERDLKEGILPAGQLAIARHGKIAASYYGGFMVDVEAIKVGDAAPDFTARHQHNGETAWIDYLSHRERSQLLYRF